MNIQNLYLATVCRFSVSLISIQQDKKLEQAKVKFDGETDVVEGMVKTATFYDPDGNAMMLAEDLTGGGE